MANEKPIPPHDDTVYMPEHPAGDGRANINDDTPFAGYGSDRLRSYASTGDNVLTPIEEIVRNGAEDLARRKLERAQQSARQILTPEPDRVAEQKARLEAQSRVADAARRNSYRRGR